MGELGLLGESTEFTIDQPGSPLHLHALRVELAELILVRLFLFGILFEFILVILTRIQVFLEDVCVEKGVPKRLLTTNRGLLLLNGWDILRGLGGSQPL